MESGSRGENCQTTTIARLYVDGVRAAADGALRYGDDDVRPVCGE